jgi:hypothetical protein
MANAVAPPLADDRDLIVAPPLVQPLAIASATDLTLDPDAVQGTRFSGPILSGPVDGTAAGIVPLHKRFKLTFANGTFSVPVVFPASTILDRLVIQLQQSYTGTLPKINLGTALNGVDIANVDVSVAPTQIFNNLTAILGSTWTIYLSQAWTGSPTTGKATVLIYYSVPAKALPT